MLVVHHCLEVVVGLRVVGAPARAPYHRPGDEDQAGMGLGFQSTAGEEEEPWEGAV